MEYSKNTKYLYVLKRHICEAYMRNLFTPQYQLPKLFWKSVKILKIHDVTLCGF